MKATIKLVAVAGIAGLSLAACGTSHPAAVNSTSNSTTSSVPTTTVPANAPVGFNAAKTEFVLPYKLGLLPASELALAKADAAYAAGLGNSADWSQFGTSVVSGPDVPPKTIQLWYYIGGPAMTPTSSSGLQVGGAKTFAVTVNTEVLPFGPVIHSTSVRVEASTLNTLTIPSSRSTSGPNLVGASTLEIEAGPVGTLAIGSKNTPAFCVPTPEAYVANGKVATAGGGMPVITAGPSTIFSGENITSTSPTAPKSGPLFYDKGVAACTNFH